MRPEAWTQLLESRGVDQRIVSLIAEAAGVRHLEPPTTETRQLLVALQPDGYAAGRIDRSVLSLFFTSARTRALGERHGFSTGLRNQATGIVRISAADLATDEQRELVHALLTEALDRVEPQGSWKRGLPDQSRTQGELCPVHYVQMSLTGTCPDCD